MCGIAGIVSLKGKQDLSALITMSELVAHRGPDDEGFVFFDSLEKNGAAFGSQATDPAVFNLPYSYCPKNKIERKSYFATLGLAHRRLSIFDLSAAGHQPMATAKSDVWVSYNGEIYNFPELKKELEQEGLSFSTKTDTEVLLQGYKRFGPLFFQKMNGMFAFILFDAKEKKLMAVRDRFGVKPLYYAVFEGKLYLASEIKQIALLLPKTHLNHEAAEVFLNCGISDQGQETLFKGIFELRGGHVLTLDLAKREPLLNITPWYRLKAAPFQGSFSEAAANYHTLLQDAVALRMRADVSFGSCLSGGLDSSSIVSLASKICPKTHATFSAISEEPALDESPFIQLVKDKNPLDSYAALPTFHDLKTNFDKLIWHQDLPFGSSSIYAQWSVFSLVKEKNIKVMLDGQGADELLLGYYEFYNSYLKELFKKRKWVELISELRGCKANNSHLKPYRRFFQNFLPASIEIKLKNFVKKESLNWLQEPAQRQNFFSAPNASALSEQMVLSTNLPMLLRFEDRNSMAHSIESRTPFLDYRLVEFTLGLPSNYKIAKGETKAVLREAMKGLLPEGIRTRKDKISFSTAEKKWFRENPSFFLEKLEETVAIAQGFIKKEALLDAKAMSQNKIPYNPKLFRVICFGMWLKQFKVSA